MADAALALTGALTSALPGALTACGGDAPTAAWAPTVIGACVRDELALRGPALDCAIDADCPCGAHCDLVDHTCRATCMVPPVTPAEACATGTQCDDTGRCVGPSTPTPTTQPALDAVPAAVTTTAGGAARQLAARLTVYTAAAATAAQAQVVRAVGVDGAEVSCDAATFAHDCTVTGWTFAFDGARYTATRPVRVRTVAGTPDGDGAIHLQLVDTATEVVVPAAATVTVLGGDGDYQGTVVRTEVPAAIPVSATLRGGAIWKSTSSSAGAIKAVASSTASGVSSDASTSRPMMKATSASRCGATRR